MIYFTPEPIKVCTGKTFVVLFQLVFTSFNLRKKKDLESLSIHLFLDSAVLIHYQSTH